MSNNTQPDWSEAPEGATHFNSDDCWSHWLKQHPLSFWDNGQWVRYLDDGIGSRHIDNAIPRPQPEQWENGVPPVGWHGEATYGSKTHWNECVILPDGWMSIKLGGIWVSREPEYFEGNAELRELRSPRDRAIDAAVEALKADGYTIEVGSVDMELLSTLYRLGLLREVE